MSIAEICNKMYGKTIRECSNEQVYTALLALVKKVTEERKEAQERQEKENGKKVYYISAEFLIGKLLSNNLINLGLYEQISQELEENGKNIAQIEEVEPEPSLGNGGLGRLAACFLDSIATLNLNGDGIGINYHLGLFRQVFAQNKQTEQPDYWIQKESWLTKTEVQYPVQFGKLSVMSRMYDIDVTGYEGRVNKLHLFDIDTVDEKIPMHDGIDFDKNAIEKNLTLFLYPDDSDRAGQLLRIYQQYFMVSNAAQLILSECRRKCEKAGKTLKNLNEFAVIQINDTHPTMVIPELIRILTTQKDIDGSVMTMQEAAEVVTKTCAYTNHTILAEALETWPLDYLEEVVPQLVPIIRYLDENVRARYTDSSVYIIDENDRVHMAHIDIHYGFSVNGVAKLHTEILMQEELKSFYRIYPEKFNNKTNGITFRRWLLHCNQALAAYIEELIGADFKKEAGELSQLIKYADDENVIARMLEIKTENKKRLAAYMQEKCGVKINPRSVFDIQVKRLHEYKRQQMNALYVIYKYFEIKAGNIPDTPVTVIFGAKAAKAYTIAKDIIHLILCLGELIANDPDVSPYLKVVMVENYNVTMAEKLIPASLELGGNAPFIVFDDADLDKAVEGALASKFRNAGQTCVCANRLYVQDGVYDRFAEKLQQAVSKLHIGDGLENGVTIGPLIDEKAVAKVEEHIADALEKGARVVCGGKAHERGGNFFQPTILVDVPANAKVSKEETFGPLAPLFRFKDEADVIAQANDTEFGLAAYFYTRDLSRVFRVGEALEYGIVGINTGIISNEVAPFGGIKASGLGREGSKYGIEDYLEIKYMCIGL